MPATEAMAQSDSPRGRRLARLAAAIVLGAAAFACTASAEPGLTRTVGAWIVACEQTEAGASSCEVRNDEAGKPALEQAQLLSLTLHAGSPEAEGLLRIADLELAPRLDVELAFGDHALTLDGLGRHARLAARFTLPKSELPSLASAATIRVRFADQHAQPHEITTGLAEALTLADHHL